MLALRLLGHLDLSAASGLVLDGDLLHVVADDETFLDTYAIANGERRQRTKLLERPLPEEHAARKARKPDFEALTWLPGRRLLALGSGSTLQRDTGVLLTLGAASGAMPSPPRLLDFRPLFDALRTRFSALNLEGAAVSGEVLRLLQRGGEGRPNAVIDLDLGATLSRLEAAAPLDFDVVRHVQEVALGACEGVALGFTDAAPLGESRGTIAFAAAAEDTQNPYDDGACLGSVVGLLGADGRITQVHRLAGASKIEGLGVVDGKKVVMVADPDDRTQRAPLFEADWPW